MTQISAQGALLALASGALVGALLALFGGGGSVLATPLLLYVVGVRDPHVAIGTSAAAVSFNAGLNLIGHWRGGRMKWGCASVFAGSGLAGSILGSTLAKHVDGRRLLLLFALAMAAVAILMLRRLSGEGDPHVRLGWPVALRIVPMGLAIGFAAGFFGIGGGFLIVPGLMAATGMPLAHAVASSLLSVSIFGAATAANYALSGLLDWRIAGLFIAGGFGGGLVGLRGAAVLATRAILARRLFASLVLAGAAYVGWRAVSG